MDDVEAEAVSLTSHPTEVLDVLPEGDKLLMLKGISEKFKGNESGHENKFETSERMKK